MRAAYLLCLAGGLFLARFELHSDDTGVEVFLLLTMTFLLGCLHPRHAWQWGLLVPLSIPAAHGFAGFSLAVTAFVTAVGMAGSYAGVLVRKTI